MNAALELARAKISARRATHEPSQPAGFATVRNRHDLSLAYTTAGQNSRGPILYMKIRYCRSCMKGIVLDLVREVPEGLPNAQELGVKRARSWSLECTP